MFREQLSCYHIAVRPHSIGYLHWRVRSIPIVLIVFKHSYVTRQLNGWMAMHKCIHPLRPLQHINKHTHTPEGVYVVLDIPDGRNVHTNSTKKAYINIPLHQTLSVLSLHFTPSRWVGIFRMDVKSLNVSSVYYKNIMSSCNWHTGCRSKWVTCCRVEEPAVCSRNGWNISEKSIDTTICRRDRKSDKFETSHRLPIVCCLFAPPETTYHYSIFRPDQHIRILFCWGV